LLLVDCAHHAGPILPTAHEGYLRTSGAQPAIVSNYVPIHAYMGNGTGGCAGGQPAASVVQSVMRYVESCAEFDPTAVCPPMQSPPPGSAGCTPEYYLSTTLIYCDVAATSEWYTQEISVETASLHNAVPLEPANRLFGNDPRAQCPPPGQTTPANYFYWSNPGDASSLAYWLTNWFGGGQIAGRAYVATFLDNMEIGRPFESAEPVEYESLQTWRRALGTFMASLLNGATPYTLEANILGPGGGNYPPNNASGAGEGIVNEAVDVTDVCDADASASNVTGYVAERPWEAGSGARLLAGGNPKIFVNTASLFWSDANCRGNIEQLNAADTLTLRMVTKAMEFIVTPPSAQASPSGQAVTEWRYTIGTTTGSSTAASEVPAFPEDLLVMVAPSTPLRAWNWSGSYDGGGCSSVRGQLSADIGGTHDVTFRGHAVWWERGTAAITRRCIFAKARVTEKGSCSARARPLLISAASPSICAAAISRTAKHTITIWRRPAESCRRIL